MTEEAESFHWSLTVERRTVRDALPPGRPAPVHRRCRRRDRPGVRPASFVVGPPDPPVEAAELEPGPPDLPGAERVIGAVAIAAGVLATLRPDGERQGRVPLHSPELKKYDHIKRQEQEGISETTTAK